MLRLLIRAAAALGSPSSRAEEPKQKVVRLGFVGPESPFTTLRGVEAFWARLRELGWIREDHFLSFLPRFGQKLVVEERWAQGRIERLPALMSEVIAQNVEVLFTYHTPAAVAAQKATTKIPIVAAWIGDAVGAGLATNLSRPGGNITEISLAFAEGLGAKWLQLLRETLPRLSSAAVIVNPANPSVGSVRRELEGAARAQGLTLQFVEVSHMEGFDPAFYRAQREDQAALVLGDPLTMHNLQRIQSLSVKHRMPTMCTDLEFAQLGGLMAYGVDSVPVFRRAADYLDKILRGAKPGDLPIEQANKFEFVVNLKAAKVLGVNIPESILQQADEVIR